MEMDIENSDPFFEEIKQLAERISPRSCSNLYHYTSLDSLMGMLETKQLFISNVNFMNDTSEMLYAETLLKELICMHEDIKPELSALIEENMPSISKTFVLSLSTADDALPMWYNFTSSSSSSTGLCINMNLDHITSRVWRNLAHNNYGSNTHLLNDNNPPPFIGSVIYKEDKQKKFLSDVINCYIKYRAKLPPEIIGKTFSYILSIIFSCFKKPKFDIEQEIRLVINFDDEEEYKRYVHMRVSRGLIIPYIRLNFLGSYIKDLGQQIPIPLKIKGITVLSRGNYKDIEKGLEDVKEYGFQDKSIKIIKSIYDLRY